MRWHIIAVGKPRLEFARLGLDEYVARLRPFTPTTVQFVKGSFPGPEGSELLERSKSMFRVVLDERGEQVSSRDLSRKFCDWEMHGKRDAALLVGGAGGLCDEVRQAAGWTWSLSKLTLQHELALVVALEQIYRAYTIKAGLPYHRE
jgi:23S rRNA (pseudouridine1915-N3)-methyltransferase